MNNRNEGQKRGGNRTPKKYYPAGGSHLLRARNINDLTGTDKSVSFPRFANGPAVYNENIAVEWRYTSGNLESESSRVRPFSSNLDSSALLCAFASIESVVSVYRFFVLYIRGGSFKRGHDGATNIFCLTRISRRYRKVNNW